MNAELCDTYGVRERLSSPAFAGRDAELDQLRGALGSLDTTGARTILVGGDAGVGKTRLVEEFCARARAAGSLVAAGVCTPAEGGGLPYGPIVGVLRDLSRQLDERSGAALLTPARAALGLSDRPAVPVIGSTTAQEMGKTHLFEALLAGFAALGERSRVVVVFEDLHWADSASLEVIDFLARNLGDSPVLLLATYRAEELDHAQMLRRMLAEFGRHRAVSHLELSGFDRDATALLMGAILGHQPDWALLDAVQARSEGNPFFAEELTAASGTPSLPTALRNVIMLRVERLGLPARHVAAIVAAAGGSIDHAVLSMVTDLDADALEAAIAETVEQHVLTFDDRSRFRFRHALQGEAVYGTLLPPERARLHRGLAVALTAHPEYGASGPGHGAVELAGHWWEAGDAAEALPAALRAADAMAALPAMPEAYAQYERAVAAYERLPEAPRTVDPVDLRLKAADAAYLTGHPQRCVELVNTALADLDVTSDPRRAANAFTMLGRNAWSIGDTDGAFAALHRAVQLLPVDPPSVELAGVMAEEARSLMLISHFAEAEARCREALAIARAAGARAEEGHALCTLGCCVADRGEYDEGIAHIREALAIAEESGRPDHLNRAYANLAEVLAVAGRLAEAASVIDDDETTPERFVDLRLSAAGENCGIALIRLGRWSDAADLLHRMEDRGVGSCIFGPYAVRATLDIRRGQFTRAAERLDEGDALSEGIETVQVRGWLHMLRAELALEEGRPSRAHDEIDRALSFAAGTDERGYRPEMYALGLRALADEHDAARARGRRIDTDKFHRLAAQLVEQADLCVARPDSDNVAAPHQAAMLAQCRAEETRLHSADADQWQLAATRWDDASEPHRAAYCRWREAEAVLGSRGGRPRATDAAQAAWRTAVALGAAPLQERIERLAQRARITLVADNGTDADTAESTRTTVAADLGLTPREVEVLAQLALGKTDRQIADELFISKKTASVHVSNLLRKLDASNRIEAAEIGQQAGLSAPTRRDPTSEGVWTPPSTR